MSNRPNWQLLLPEEWQHNAKYGLCIVCGKPKPEFKDQRSTTCSNKCKKKYVDRIKSWVVVREKILKRDNNTCQICGITQEQYWIKEADASKERKRKAIEWLKANAKEEMERLKNEMLTENESYAKYILDNIEKCSNDDFIAQELYRKATYIDYNDLEKRIPDFRRSDANENEHFVLHVDHIKALVNNGDMWDESNLRTICGDCHKQKTKEDLEESKHPGG